MRGANFRYETCIQAYSFDDVVFFDITHARYAFLRMHSGKRYFTYNERLHIKQTEAGIVRKPAH